MIFEGVSKVFERSLKSQTFSDCVKEILRVFQRLSKSVSRKFSWYLKSCDNITV